MTLRTDIRYFSQDGTLTQAGAQAIGTEISASVTSLAASVAILQAADATETANAPGSAPRYSCRAWVQFSGTGSAVIAASGNVSSVTYNSTGDYTVNFTTAMPDASYAAVASTQIAGNPGVTRVTSYTASSVTIRTFVTAAATDATIVSLAIFR